MKSQFSYFIPKRWCYESAELDMPANSENLAVATGLEKVSFHSNPREGQCHRMFKLLHSCTHLTSSQNNAKKFFKPGFNSTWTMNFQMFKLDLEKAVELEIKLPTSIGSLKKQESLRKISTSALLTTPKTLTVSITINGEKFWKRWEYQTTLPASWETVCRSRSSS